MRGQGAREQTKRHQRQDSGAGGHVEAHQVDLGWIGIRHRREHEKSERQLGENQHRQQPVKRNQ